MIDIDGMAKALKVKYIAKMIDESHEKWVNIPNVYFNPMTITDFMSCRFKDKWIPQSVPQFYRQCLIAYNLIRAPLEYDMYHLNKETLWLNKHVTKRDKPIYLQDWYEAGIMFLGDILDANNDLKLPEQLRLEYGINISNFLEYYSLRQAIPHTWKEILSNSPKSNFYREVEPEVIIQENRTLLKGLPNRFIYWRLVEEITTAEPSFFHYWRTNFELVDNQLTKFFRLPYDCVRDSKMHALQYKIIALIYPCRVKLFQWRIMNDSICLYCKQHDDLQHHFWHCESH